MKLLDNKKEVISAIIILGFCSVTKGGFGIKSSICSCAKINKNYEKRMIKIIGGNNVEGAKYPFMTGLLEGSESDFLVESVQCGATIINSLQLLTAAHCINPSSNYSVVVGVLNLFKADKTNIKRVSQVEIHPDFNENSLDGDLAIITLDHPLEFNLGKIGQVCLSLNKRQKSSEFKIIGWGYVSNTTTSTYLKEVTVEEYSFINCYHLGYRSLSKKKQFCTLSKDKGPCLGDSGGPVLWYDEEKQTYILAGIVSKGPEDCRTLPTVHTDIQNSKYMEWIKQKSRDSICLIDNQAQD